MAPFINAYCLLVRQRLYFLFSYSSSVVLIFMYCRLFRAKTRNLSCFVLSSSFGFTYFAFGFVVVYQKKNESKFRMKRVDSWYGYSLAFKIFQKQYGTR